MATMMMAMIMVTVLSVMPMTLSSLLPLVPSAPFYLAAAVPFSIPIASSHPPSTAIMFTITTFTVAAAVTSTHARLSGPMVA